MFEKLSNLGSLLKQAHKIGGQMKELSEKLKQHRVVGTSGGGMVEIEVNGLMEVLRCTIEPSLIEQGDRELIEDLVVAAVNQAIVKGKQRHADAMREATGGLEIPGIQQAMEQFGAIPGDELPEDASEDTDSAQNDDESDPTKEP